MGSLALYYYYRFQLSGEEFPSMATSRDWFDIMGIVTNSKGDCYKYNTQYTALRKKIDKLKLRTTKVFRSVLLLFYAF
jgi:hypothetical protein